MAGSIAFIVMVFAIGLVFGIGICITLMDWQISKGRLPIGMKKNRAKILALLKSEQEGGDAHP